MKMMREPREGFRFAQRVKFWTGSRLGGSSSHREHNQRDNAPNGKFFDAGKRATNAGKR
jgi:hypothetical protein